MNKYIFIDTNLYRNLLQSESMSSKILDVLEKLIQNDGYVLLLPQQVIDEINRGRSSNWFNPKNNTNYINLKENLGKIKDSIDSDNEIDILLKKIDDTINENTLDDLDTRKELISSIGLVEKNLEKLKSISLMIVDSKEAMDKAYMRTMKGNPPYEIAEDKKGCKLNTKICDAYIWEQLKEFFLNKLDEPADLLFFSENVNDWCIQVGEEKIFHPFLFNEIKKDLNVNLVWKRSLEELPKLTKIEKDSIQSESLEIIKQKIYNDFIPSLLNSNNWNSTDSLIRKYSDYIESLIEDDISKILEASIENNRFSLGPYNQVLMASEAVEFFSKLFKYSEKKGFSLDPWIKFYEKMDDESRKHYDGLKETLTQHDYYYFDNTKEFVYIPF